MECSAVHFHCRAICRFGFGDVSASTGVVVKMRYQSPEMHEVFVAGTEVPESFSPISIADVNGAHFWENSVRRLTVVIKGEDHVVIKTIDSVQVRR